MILEGNIVDVIQQEIYQGRLHISNSIITNIERVQTKSERYIIPGLIDSHVHIESSMLVPAQFSKLVVPRGTVAVVTDPHEIANVLGIKGVEYMIDDASKTPLKCFFGAPSCVPATSFESSGACLDSNDIASLLVRDDIWFLSEMMNFPGVIYDDEEVVAKLRFAQKAGKPIDGHAPGISGDNLIKYAQSGISTDHECVNTKEAIDKINQGMVVQIREGSAAKNFDALVSLFESHPDDLMLCTDDSHPDEIIHFGHIDKIIKKGIKQEVDIFKLLRAATLKPVQHYNLPVGLLQEGDRADIVVLDNLKDFNVLQTYIDGQCVFDGELKFDTQNSHVVNQFNASPIRLEEILVQNKGAQIRVIEAMDGDLLTNEYIWNHQQNSEFINSNIDEDILKIVVMNRYNPSKPVVGFMKNIGLKSGAFACSVAHDSHNLIAVGVDDTSIISALNSIIENKGGISVVDNNGTDILPLEVAGLMTTKNGVEVARKYESLNTKVKEMGATLKAPFMTLSFMSLLVIPSIKIGDMGLFDVNSFSFTSLFV